MSSDVYVLLAGMLALEQIREAGTPAAEALGRAETVLERYGDALLTPTLVVSMAAEVRAGAREAERPDGWRPV